MKKKIGLGLVALAVAVGMTACGGGSDGASADAGDFCAKAKSFTELSDTTGSLFENGAADSAEIKETWTEVTERLDEFEKAAPDEVRGDIATVTGAIDGFSALLEDADYNLTTVITKAASDPSILEQFESLDDAEVEAAADRVETYVKAECGIDLDDEG